MTRSIDESLFEQIGKNNTTDIDAAIYARTSSVSQRFGYSIDEQIRLCWQRCDRLGWTVTHVCRDEAVSGKDPERPMFQKLISYAKAGLIDVVVFWKLDRFSRSLIHAVQLEKEFREVNVGLHSVTEQIDTTTPTGRFNFRNISSASEFERELIRQRSQMGMKALALDHRWPNNRPPYGYNKDNDGRLVPDESQAEVVKKIFEKYKNQKSMSCVAKQLNSEGITKQNGAEWTLQNISYILRNRIYIGDYDVAGVTDQVDEYQIVDNSLFEQCEEVRMRFKKGESSRKTMAQAEKKKKVNRIKDSYLAYILD